MEKSTVLRELRRLYTLGDESQDELGNSNYSVFRKEAPPYIWIGLVMFDSNGKLIGVQKEWAVEASTAADVAQAVYGAFSSLTDDGAIPLCQISTREQSIPEQTFDDQVIDGFEFYAVDFYCPNQKSLKIVMGGTNIEVQELLNNFPFVP